MPPSRPEHRGEGSHSSSGAVSLQAVDQKAPISDAINSPQPGHATERPAIESAQGLGEDDEFEIEDGLPIDGTTSVASSVYACTYENGRRYHHFKNGRYPIPNDDREQDREDMKHAMLMELTDGVLFFSPVGDHPQSIVDIGTGTG